MRAARCDAESGDNFYAELVASLTDLRGFARVLCREHDRADDLVQDAVVRALAARDLFQPGTNFRAWIFTILRNLHISAFRQRRMHLEPLDMVDQVLLQEPTQEEALTMRKLQEAVQQLPRHRREALILIVAHGLSYEQVATVCGCAVGTIKSRVARAREQLHAAIEGEGTDPSSREPHVRGTGRARKKPTNSAATQARSNNRTPVSPVAVPKVVALTECS